MSDTFVVDAKGTAQDLPAEEPIVEEPKVEDGAPEPEAEDAPDGDGDTAEQDTEESEDEDEPQPKKKNRVPAGKRIGQLTAIVRGLERQLSEVKAGGQTPAKPAAMPKQEDYETAEEYIDARAGFVAEQRFAQLSRQNEEAKRTAQQEKMAESFRQRSEAASDKYDDYDDVIEASEVPITNAIGHAIMESDLGPDISYYLAKHPAEAREIIALTPIGQVRAIGKLEAKLSAPAALRPKKTTAAPAPPKTLRPGAKPVVDPDKMPINDWMEHERKRLRDKGKL